MSRIEYVLAALVLRTWYLICTLLPIRADKVVLASARSERLEGNLLAVRDELVRTRPEAHIVLLLDRYSYSFAGKVRYLWRLIAGATTSRPRGCS